MFSHSTAMYLEPTMHQALYQAMQVPSPRLFTEKNRESIVYSVSYATLKIYKGSYRGQENVNHAQTGGINDGFIEEMTQEVNVTE